MEATTKALINGNIRKAEKKSEVAEKLLKSSDHEDAVSRACYAVYHAAQALLLSEGERAETHKGVITLFGLLFVKTGKFSKNLGKYLANLKDVRENGSQEETARQRKKRTEFIERTGIFQFRRRRIRSLILTPCGTFM